MKYKYVGLGGTFDHFHAGHAAFLKGIAERAEHLLIGISRPELLTKKAFIDQLEPYHVREQAVINFCKQATISCGTFPLTDIYGPTLTDKRIEAVFVTPETESGGLAINKKRSELQLSPLSIERVTLLQDEVGAIISSQRIRKGEISRQGAVYKKLFTNTLTLNQLQREFFSNPHGKIVTKPSENHSQVFCCVVGDTSFETFVERNWPYSLGVIDFKKKREHVEPAAGIIEKITTFTANPAGQIASELISVLEKLINSSLVDKSISNVLKVDGEEDLVAVAAALLLPLGSTIYYGQPGIGMVEVVVTEQIKSDFYKTLAH